MVLERIPDLSDHAGLAALSTEHLGRGCGRLRGQVVRGLQVLDSFVLELGQVGGDFNPGLQEGVNLHLHLLLGLVHNQVGDGKVPKKGREKKTQLNSL